MVEPGTELGRLVPKPVVLTTRLACLTVSHAPPAGVSHKCESQSPWGVYLLISPEQGRRSTAGLLHCPPVQDLWREVPALGLSTFCCGSCQNPQEAGTARGSLVATGRMGCCLPCGGAPSVEVTFLFLKSPKEASEGQNWDWNPKASGLQAQALTQPGVKRGGFPFHHSTG